MLTEIRGLRFRGPEARNVVSMLQPGDPIGLDRDASNEYDANAVRLLAEGTWIGYVQADLAVIVAEYMDQGQLPRAWVSGQNAPNGTPYVEIERPKAKFSDTPSGVGFE